MPWLLMLLLSLLWTTAVNAQACYLTVTNLPVNEESDYTFIFVTSSISLDTNAMKIEFTLDSTITTSVVSSVVANNPQNFVGGTSSPTFTVGVDSSTSASYVIIQNLLPNKSKYEITIDGVKNAQSAKTVSDTKCYGCTDDTCGTTLVTATAGSVTYTPNTLIEADVLPEITTGTGINGNDADTLTIATNIRNPIVVGGSIAIRVPKTNLNYNGQGTPYLKSYITDTTSYTMTVSDALSSSTNPTAITLAASPEYISSLEYDVFQVRLGNTVEIDANHWVIVTITPVTLSPSKATLTGFGIWTGDGVQAAALQFYNIIDQIYGLTYANTVAGSFINTTDSITTVTADNTLVEESGVTLTFQLQPANDIPQGSEIFISWPSTWAVDCSSTYTLTCIESCTTPTLPMSCESANQQMYSNNLFSSLSDYFHQGSGTLEFSISGWTNPSTTEGQELTVTTKHSYSGWNDIDTLDSFYLEFEPGTISISTFYPNQTAIYNSDGNYTIKFTPQHAIKTTHKIVIQWPTTFTLLQNSACTVSEITATSYTCSANSANNYMTIGNFVDSDQAAGTEITINVDSVENPGNYDSPGTITMQMYTTDDGLIDEGTYTVPSGLFNGTYMKYFGVEASDLTAGASPVSYNFEVTPLHRVAQSSYLQIALPDEITVSDSNRLNRGCGFEDIEGFSSSSVYCYYVSSTHSVNVLGGFNAGDSSGNPPTLEFTIPYLKNPRSVTTTGYFNVTIYDYSDELLYYFNETLANMSTAPNVTMTGFSTPSDIEYTRTSEENGQITNYTFLVTAGNYYETGDVVFFTLPEGVRFTDNTECYETSWIRKGLTCDLSRDRQTVNFTLDFDSIRRRLSEEEVEDERRPLSEEESKRRDLAILQSGEILEFVFTNVTNPDSFRPTDGSISYRIQSGAGDMVEGLSEGLIIQNTVASQLSNMSTGITPNYWEKSVPANYTVIFNPINYEQNMQIHITVPGEIGIPDEGVTCKGLQGTDSLDITCIVIPYNRTIVLTDAVTSREVQPETIEFEIISLTNPNPENATWTESFVIATYTPDGFLIDNMTSDLALNFLCTFPCQTCNQEIPSQCYSCYTASTPSIYLFDNDCLSECPSQMYAVAADPITKEVPTCKFCEFPCENCTRTPLTCTTCSAGYLFYDIENTCYEEINYPFPFLAMAVLFFLLVLCVDCIKKSTNFLHSLIFFLSYLEIGVWGFLIYLYMIDEVKGDRSLSVVSMGAQVLLNLFFIPVHKKLMLPEASPQYKQIFEQYKCSSWTVQSMAYVINFKMSLFLVSSFGSRPRFSGTFNQSSWGKFNLFAVVYIILVYLTFMGDFYIYFTENGLRSLTSFVAIEGTIIMTIISLILVLEIISQCACTGIREQDLGKRAGLNFGKGKLKKKRRALRSGMGNEESDYDDELYDSEEDYGEEMLLSEEKKESVDPIEEEEEEEAEEDLEDEYDEEYDDEEVGITKAGRKKTLKGTSAIDEEDDEYDGEDDDPLESRQSLKKPKSIAGKKIQPTKGKPGAKGKITPKGEPESKNLDMLEALAEEFKSAMEAQKREKEEIAKRMAELEDREQHVPEPVQDELEKLKQEGLTKSDLPGVIQDVEQIINQKLHEMEENKLISGNNKPTIVLPQPVNEPVVKEKELSGDDEYWLQNVTACNEDVSDYATGVKVKDASEIEFIQNEPGMQSNIGSVREMSDTVEMNPAISTGPARGDVSGPKSMNATEENYLDRSDAAYGVEDGKREKDATPQDFYDEGNSAVFSNVDGGASRNATEQNFLDKSGAEFGKVTPREQEKDATEIDQLERRSAEFGDTSGIDQPGSRQDFLNKSDAAFGRDSKMRDKSAYDEQVINATPHIDKDGRSDESDEGVVADHKPFTGIKNAIEQQEERRRQERPASQEVDAAAEEEDEDNRPSGRRRIKQVLYSDKSESSVDDMMADTPSNYNIANGRLEGKSMGLKAILLYAKNQGIQLGKAGQQLPQIQEEGRTPNPNALNKGSAMQSSGEGGTWRAMNQPMNAEGHMMGGDEGINRTLDPDRPSKNSRTKRNPGVQKQFKEPDTDRQSAAADLKNIRKNNFV